MASTLVIMAHPQLQRSRVNAPMLENVTGLPGITVHDLYELYPDFFIDAEHEQQALGAAERIVLQFPLQWYGCPSLLKEWLDVVLREGWAYGQGGTALQGKELLLVVSTGSAAAEYTAEGRHGRPLETYLHDLQQTGLFCGMTVAPHLLFYDASHAADEAVEQHCQTYRQRLLQPLPTEG